MLDSVIISKEELARQFNVSRATVYRLAAKLDKEFIEQTQQV
jgi:DNA-binding MurR/RpiR family transcriptional regulator